MPTAILVITQNVSHGTCLVNRIHKESRTMKFELPVIRDHGSIVENTFYRCPSGTGTVYNSPPKNPEDMIQDKFGECSHS